MKTAAIVIAGSAIARDQLGPAGVPDQTHCHEPHQRHRRPIPRIEADAKLRMGAQQTRQALNRRIQQERHRGRDQLHPQRGTAKLSDRHELEQHAEQPARQQRQEHAGQRRGGQMRDRVEPAVIVEGQAGEGGNQVERHDDAAGDVDDVGGFRGDERPAVNRLMREDERFGGVHERIGGVGHENRDQDQRCRRRD